MNALEPLHNKILRASELLRNARHAVALTGAGISTPSGIPDFRSANTGLWTKNDPMQVASLSAFLYHPERFFNWLRPLLDTILQAQPNPAHFALAELESKGILKALITQNIDDLHQQAGSKNVLPVHGTMENMICLSCDQLFRSTQFIEIVRDGNLPLCPNCGRTLKPDIVLFEEMLPSDIWSKAEWHCNRADVILVAGSSLEVMPAAALPWYAVQNGAHLIIINYSPTPLDSEAEILLPGDVAKILPEITAQC